MSNRFFSGGQPKNPDLALETLKCSNFFIIRSCAFRFSEITDIILKHTNLESITLYLLSMGGTAPPCDEGNLRPIRIKK